MHACIPYISASPWNSGSSCAKQAIYERMAPPPRPPPPFSVARDCERIRVRRVHLAREYAVSGGGENRTDHKQRVVIHRGGQNEQS